MGLANLPSWLAHQLTQPRSRRWLRRLRWGLLGLLTAWIVVLGIRLWTAARAPVDSILVLGGSIKREMYIAQQARDFPERPILISAGSQPPCVRILYDRAASPLTQTWLEPCADSTFGNFYYSLPVLQRWGSRKIGLVTSPTHLPRALWMARIILGSHGIWVKPDLVQEVGITGNKESWFKTRLDCIRAVAWAGISQFYQPQCDRLQSLDTVDMAVWQAKGFRCERQAGIDSPEE